jgi:hypothetical protein
MEGAPAFIQTPKGAVFPTGNKSLVLVLHRWLVGTSERLWRVRGGRLLGVSVREEGLPLRWSRRRDAGLLAGFT